MPELGQNYGLQNQVLWTTFSRLYNIKCIVSLEQNRISSGVIRQHIAPLPDKWQQLPCEPLSGVRLANPGFVVPARMRSIHVSWLVMIAKLSEVREATPHTQQAPSNINHPGYLPFIHPHLTPDLAS